jgi:hypothetical protein
MPFRTKLGRIKMDHKQQEYLEGLAMKLTKVVFLLCLFFPSYLSADFFGVSNVTEFQDALDSAGIKDGDDLIVVSPGFYDLSSVTLTYTPSKNKSLLIQGAGAGKTILYGGDVNQIMDMSTLGLADDSGTYILVNGFTFRNARELAEHGGALSIETDEANVSLVNSEFRNNVCQNNGGGAYVSSNYGILIISNNIFIDNSNIGGGPSYVTYSGGGLCAKAIFGSMNLESNIFIDNSAVDQGGGMVVSTSSGTINFLNNLFRGNHATYSSNVRGGGAYFVSYTGLLNITNNTFIYNSGIHGGGIHIELNENSAFVNIYNNIIWGNDAEGDGDDIYIMDDREWDNTGSPVSLYYNNFKGFFIWDGDNLSQGSNLDVDPCFTPSFHLQAGSPCIDAGTNAAPMLPVSDFEGDPRVFDGNYNGFAHADMGADENVGSMPVPIFGGNDYTGNGLADLSVWRISNGRWYIYGTPSVVWGKVGDIPVAGNYDGDVNGITEIAVWRPTNGKWYVLGSPSETWGADGDIPVPGDYDGDGATEIAVWRPSNGKWYVKGMSTVAWGTDGDIPVPGDYDGDGATEIAVWRPTNGKWYVLGSPSEAWGMNGDIPIPGDYDGDGTTEIAVWRPSNGRWYIKGMSTAVWGTKGDIPAPGDYDGDGAIEVAVWRPSNGSWYILGIGSYAWGLAGDMPLVR